MYHYLFNFSASFSGGGLKRLHYYSQWFNENGGAFFIIHPNCDRLQSEFPSNRYFVVNFSSLKRLINECGYLSKIEKSIPKIDLYYSYGIPFSRPIGKLNWLHISNVLPLIKFKVPLTYKLFLQMKILELRLVKSYQYADVISAESRFSLGMVDPIYCEKLFLSVNGSDDEIDACHKPHEFFDRDNVAVIVGTVSYKCIADSYRLYLYLRETVSELKLIIVGDKVSVPEYILHDNDVTPLGLIDRKEVVHILSKCRFYISNTAVENSFNASSEGVFLSQESYISDIPPHRELLAGIPYTIESIPNVAKPMIKVVSKDLNSSVLKSWDEVISSMVTCVSDKLSR